MSEAASMLEKAARATYEKMRLVVHPDSIVLLSWEDENHLLKADWMAAVASGLRAVGTSIVGANVQSVRWWLLAGVVLLANEIGQIEAFRRRALNQPTGDER